MEDPLLFAWCYQCVGSAAHALFPEALAVMAYKRPLGVVGVAQWGSSAASADPGPAPIGLCDFFRAKMILFWD